MEAASTQTEVKSTPNEAMHANVPLRTPDGASYSSLQELTQDITDDGSGYHLRVEEIRTGQVGLSWGIYMNPTEQLMRFHPQQMNYSCFRCTNLTVCPNVLRLG